MLQAAMIELIIPIWPFSFYCDNVIAIKSIFYVYYLFRCAQLIHRHVNKAIIRRSSFRLLNKAVYS